MEGKVSDVLGDGTMEDFVENADHAAVGYDEDFFVSVVCFDVFECFLDSLADLFFGFTVVGGEVVFGFLGEDFWVCFLFGNFCDFVPILSTKGSTVRFYKAVVGYYGEIPFFSDDFCGLEGAF